MKQICKNLFAKIGRVGRFAVLSAGAVALAAGVMSLGPVRQARAQAASQSSSYNPIQLVLSTNACLKAATNTLGAVTNIISITNATVLYTNNTGSGSPGFVTNSVVTTTTNTTYPWINVASQAKVGVQFSFNCSGASVSNVYVVFAQSVDGIATNVSTTGNITWVIPCNGATTVNAVTNFSGLGVGYLLPVSIGYDETTSGRYATNFVMTYASKKYAP